MSRYAGQRSKKTGTPPGTLVHVGKHRTDRVTASIMEYNETDISEKQLDMPFDYSGTGVAGSVRWVNIDGLHDAGVLEKLGKDFKLHPLVLEDMLNTEQRPKIEDYGDYIYIVIKNLYNTGEGDIETEHQSIILGGDFVISVGEKENNFFENIKDRLKSGGRIRKLGADYLAYSLLDTIVDYYFDVLEALGERIEETEEQLMAKPGPEVLRSINRLKRDMLFVHRSIWPLREVAGLLERGDSRLVRESTRVYTRDLYDHIIQSLDTTEIYRDILSGMLDIYLSSLSNRMNEIMKVLTIISTLFIPLTFLAGLYGMNFRFMPELEWPWGYPAVLLAMAVTALLMLAFFRRKKWL